MRKHHKFIFYVLLVLGLFPFLSMSQAHAEVTLGTVAENIRAPASMLANAFYNICYIAGSGFFLAGLFQFKAHRESPQEIPISRPIMLVVVGLFIFLLPFIGEQSPASATLL